jgi:hypothetical protein
VALLEWVPASAPHGPPDAPVPPPDAPPASVVLLLSADAALVAEVNARCSSAAASDNDASFLRVLGAVLEGGARDGQLVAAARGAAARCMPRALALVLDAACARLDVVDAAAACAAAEDTNAGSMLRAALRFEPPASVLHAAVASGSAACVRACMAQGASRGYPFGWSHDAGCAELTPTQLARAALRGDEMAAVLHALELTEDAEALERALCVAGFRQYALSVLLLVLFKAVFSAYSLHWRLRDGSVVCTLERIHELVERGDVVPFECVTAWLSGEESRQAPTGFWEYSLRIPYRQNLFVLCLTVFVLGYRPGFRSSLFGAVLRSRAVQVLRLVYLLHFTVQPLVVQYVLRQIWRLEECSRMLVHDVRYIVLRNWFLLIQSIFFYVELSFFTSNYRPTVPVGTFPALRAALMFCSFIQPTGRFAVPISTCSKWVDPLTCCALLVDAWCRHAWVKMRAKRTKQV